jgi:hypothetical protein
LISVILPSSFLLHAQKREPDCSGPHVFRQVFALTFSIVFSHAFAAEIVVKVLCS